MIRADHEAWGVQGVHTTRSKPWTAAARPRKTVMGPPLMHDGRSGAAMAIVVRWLPAEVAGGGRGGHAKTIITVAAEA
jgi:hypothetical protein